MGSYEESEQRVKRGCTIVAVLLVAVTLISADATGPSIITYVSAGLLLFAIVILIAANWPQRK